MSYSRLTTNLIESDEDAYQSFSANNEEITIIIGLTKDESFVAIGYKNATFLNILYHIIGIITCGFIYLLAYWRPDWVVRWKQRKSSIEDADTLILKDVDDVIHVVKIQKSLIEKNIITEYFSKPDNATEQSQQQHISQELFACSSFMAVKYFIFQYLKYIWNPLDKRYECVIGLKKGSTIGDLLRNYQGYTHSDEQTRLRFYGKNEIGIEIKSYLQLLMTEILNPFYIFQVASIILWSMDDYYLYAFCIFVISCLSIGLSLYATRKQSEKLQDLIEASNPKSVCVSRLINGSKTEIEIEASDVIPGDIIVIPPAGCVMACDAVLISGNAIVNESMLTGESVPVTKVSFAAYEEMEIYSPESHKKRTLFCGTAVIQTRYYGKDQVLALVTRSGYNTAKGELIRSILYPRPIDFKFYKDSLLFIGFMFIIATVGMGYSIYLYITNSRPWLQTIVRALDIITIVVPPALPAAMTVGTYYAQNRLKNIGIFCIAPARINICGKVKLVCFDKTGTLTEEGLEVWGVIGVDESITKKRILTDPCFDVSSLNHGSTLMAALATCHSLTHVNGVLIGDPLDLKMFEATKWTLEEAGEDSDCYDSLIPPIVKPPAVSHPLSGVSLLVGGGQTDSVGPFRDYGTMTQGAPIVALQRPKLIGTDAILADSLLASSEVKMPYEIGIVRQFPFSSAVQRMSVLVRVLGTPYMEVYAKGAPEIIHALCLPDSVPINLTKVLNHFTVQGFRVLALAHKRLSKKITWHNAQKMKRDQVECDLEFTGLLVLQNLLKRETKPVIQNLKSADIRSVMVTGDNILTGICVARNCGMVDAGEAVLQAKVFDANECKCLSFELANSGGLSDDLCTERGDVNIDMNEAYHLAVSGPTWHQIKKHFPEYVPWVVSQGTVFARMSPDQKIQLVEELQAADYIVGMCGDGANDCGALKAAHIGVSLSEAEASVAAPFTSRTPNITCVPKIICEGRCALVTNFSVFKYMALYSIIQFTSVLILYKACTNLSDPQFLYIDLLIVTLVAIFMGYTKARHVLVPKRPLSSLIGSLNLFSVVSQIVLVIVVQIVAYYYLLIQPWYIKDTNCEDEGDGVERVLSWETNVIFCVSSIQYLSLAVIYSPGYPFRKPLYTNAWLLITLVVLTTTSIWVQVYPLSWMEYILVLKGFPEDHLFLFRCTLLLLGGLHFVIGWAVENVVAGSPPLKKFFQLITRKKRPKNKYKRILNQIKADVNWPPIETPIYSSTIS